LGRSLADEAFEQPGRRSSLPELVDVVEDEHLVARGLLLEGLREEACERAGPRAALASRERIVGYFELESIRQPSGKRGEGTVPAVHQVPVPAAFVCNGCRQRRLAEAGARDDGREPPPLRLVEQSLQRGTAHMRSRHARRRELDARG